eukprot:Hpha_TRINITY_DN6750_c0_g1::TRINITY_DN6750_c0_g1_i2::g.111098::m.111098
MADDGLRPLFRHVNNSVLSLIPLASRDVAHAQLKRQMLEQIQREMQLHRAENPTPDSASAKLDLGEMLDAKEEVDSVVSASMRRAGLEGPACIGTEEAIEFLEKWGRNFDQTGVNRHRVMAQQWSRMCAADPATSGPRVRSSGVECAPPTQPHQGHVFAA